ncbi:Sorting and assembly machinery component 50 [Balamuthia mandrillaris]
MFMWSGSSSSSSQGRPFRVRHVYVKGNKRTKKDLLAPCMSPIFAARTAEEVSSGLLEAMRDLKHLDVFKSVRFILEDVSEPEDNRSCDLIVQVEEKKMWSLGVMTTTTVEGEEQELEGNVALSNPFGRGERLSLTTRIGAHWTEYRNNSFQVSYTKPLWAHYFATRQQQLHQQQPLRVFEWQAGRSSHDLFHSGVTQRTLSSSLVYAIGSRHQFRYEGAWREVLPFSDAASKIRLEAGHSLKSSLIHRYMVDKRDDPVLPTRGWAVQSHHELAGLGGDVRFLKGETAAQVNYPLGWGCSLNALAKGGFVVPLFGDKTRVIDRFFLGGPLSLRGFEACGVGSRQSSNALGGELYLSESLHFTFPLPLPNIPSFVKGHVFAHGGSLLPLSTGSDEENARGQELIKERMEKLWKERRTTVGLGLVFSTVFGRVELNATRPIDKQPQDLTRWWQIGLSASFL